MALILFRDELFKGGELRLVGTRSSFVPDNFNDAVTSVKVTDGQVWTLYEHTDFSGLSVTVSSLGGPRGDGQYPTADTLGGLNDTFSSARLHHLGCTCSTTFP